MSLLQLWLTLLFAFSEGYHCDMGQPVDWYPYTAAHAFVDVESLTIPLGQGMANERVLWLLSDNDDQVVFWYNPANLPHGVCARLLPDNLEVALS